MYKKKANETHFSILPSKSQQASPTRNIGFNIQDQAKQQYDIEHLKRSSMPFSKTLSSFETTQAKFNFSRPNHLKITSPRYESQIDQKYNASSMPFSPALRTKNYDEP